MKKNLLIMMMMVLCGGFAMAQTTVRGFVPAGGTTANGEDTYVVFGVPFSTIDADGPKEMAVTLAQMQLSYDTIEDVITCGKPYKANGVEFTVEQIEAMIVCPEDVEDPDQIGRRAFLRQQFLNAAQYNYDSLLVVNLYICPCTKTDEGLDYDVIALNGKCWYKSNMRKEGGMTYNSDMTKVEGDDDLLTYGRLYTWQTVLKNDVCDNDGYLQGICPEGWHLPTVEEMGYLFGTPAEDLRINGNWVVDDNNNITEFSAQPAGFYNASTQRFEGLFSEADFWMVNCDKLNESNQEILQLVYSCNTPLRITRPADDALSVRCVYDIVKRLEDCIPEENSDCPTLGQIDFQNVGADGYIFTAPVEGYDDSKVDITASVRVDYSGNDFEQNDNYEYDLTDGIIRLVVPAQSGISSINVVITLNYKGTCSGSSKQEKLVGM